jgi:hypothetical protein
VRVNENIFDVMRICYGWSKKDFYMSPEKRYLPEQLYERLKPFVSDKKQGSDGGGQLLTVPLLLQLPLWVKIDGEHVRIEGLPELKLACQLVTIYHNTDSKLPVSDGWDEETLDIEKNTFDFSMGADSSEEDEKIKGT